MTARLRLPLCRDGHSGMRERVVGDAGSLRFAMRRVVQRCGGSVRVWVIYPVPLRWAPTDRAVFLKPSMAAPCRRRGLRWLQKWSNIYYVSYCPKWHMCIRIRIDVMGRVSMANVL